MEQLIIREIYLYVVFRLLCYLDAKPVLGVIYDFNNDELYEGSINTSACLNGKEISVSKIKESQEGILVTGLPK